MVTCFVVMVTFFVNMVTLGKTEEDGECDGVQMSYSWNFLDTDGNGKNDDIQCMNQEGSCRLFSANNIF